MIPWPYYKSGTITLAVIEAPTVRSILLINAKELDPYQGL